jgi:hypothetical protein
VRLRIEFERCIFHYTSHRKIPYRDEAPEYPGGPSHLAAQYAAVFRTSLPQQPQKKIKKKILAPVC